MRLRIGSLLAGALALAFAAAPARADKVHDLIDHADNVMRGNSTAAVFTMEVVTKSYQRSFKVVVWDDARGAGRTLIKILGPALWRGFGTLKLGDQLKLYDPKTNHVQVVGHSMLGDSWMGSHFTNDDLVKETRLARDYDVKLLDQHKGTTDQGDADFYRVQLKPKPTAPVSWGRIVYELWEQGDVVMPTRADYYRKPGDKSPARTMTFSGVKKMGGRLVPSVMTVTLASKPGEHTSITYETLKFDVAIPDAKFTEQALRR